MKTVHGVIFAEFKRYVVDMFGLHAWSPLLEDAGLKGHIFLPDQVYPDENFQAILQATARKMDEQDTHELQESFGRHVAPGLMQMYHAQINPAWGSLDLIENAETTIHRIVRLRDPNAAPPRLKCTRVSTDVVRIHYTSPRRLCGVAIGISRGVAEHYEDRVHIKEEGCMLKGNDFADIHVHREAG